jgi:hypothetical protein
MASLSVRALVAITCLFYAHLSQGAPWNEVKCYQNNQVFQPQMDAKTQSYKFEPKHPGQYTFKLTVQDFCEVSPHASSWLHSVRH